MATSARPTRRRFLRRIRRPSAAFSALVVAGAVLVAIGVGMVFLPAALVLAGLAAVLVGWVGLGVNQ
jgi:fatty acid desaturase